MSTSLPLSASRIFSDLLGLADGPLPGAARVPPGHVPAGLQHARGRFMRCVPGARVRLPHRRHPGQQLQELEHQGS